MGGKILRTLPLPTTIRKKEQKTGRKKEEEKENKQEGSQTPNVTSEAKWHSSTDTAVVLWNNSRKEKKDREETRAGILT